MARHALARRLSYINRQKRKSDAEVVVQLLYNILYLVSIFEMSGKESHRVSSCQIVVLVRN